MDKLILSPGEQKKILHFIGKPFYSRPKSNWCKKIDRTKILDLPDPHAPYQHKPTLEHALQNHHDAGTLIIPGDIGDFYSKSRFRKTRHQSFKEELAKVFELMEWMATNWTDVRIMLGNHDNRLEKLLLDSAGKDTDILLITELNLLERLTSFFDNVRMVGTEIDGIGIDERIKIHVSHIYQHGDIVFTHAEKSLKQKSSLMTGISESLFRWKGRLGLEPYRVIAQAHNHADMRMTMGDEKWFLTPSAADPKSIGLEYVFNTRMMGDPGVMGYAVFYQENKITDYNRSHNWVME